MDCRSVELSSAMPVPFSVTTMPRKVPSMPSSTRKPARYGVSAGPGRPTRSPSMRRRTAFCSEGCNCVSQAPRLAGGAVSSATALLNVDVAWWKRCSSSAPIT
jgi:hypothetical protein